MITKQRIKQIIKFWIIPTFTPTYAGRLFLMAGIIFSIHIIFFESFTIFIEKACVAEALYRNMTEDDFIECGMPIEQQTKNGFFYLFLTSGMFAISSFLFSLKK